VWVCPQQPLQMSRQGLGGPWGASRDRVMHRKYHSSRRYHVTGLSLTGSMLAQAVTRRQTAGWQQCRVWGMRGAHSTSGWLLSWGRLWRAVLPQQRVQQEQQERHWVKQQQGSQEGEGEGWEKQRCVTCNQEQRRKKCISRGCQPPHLVACTVKHR
jgi:hypothetical protein